MLLVAPEQRMSLQLKWHEFWSSHDSGVCGALHELADMQYIDLLDESDELLNHRYQCNHMHHCYVANHQHMHTGMPVQIK